MSEREPSPPVRRLFAELDFPVAEGRRANILDAVVDALEPLYALLIDAGGKHRGEGERAFAMFHLAARSLSDLTASAHLMSHGYLQQAHSTGRPVLESCDLIELFARKPGEAARWVSDEMAGKTYSPRRVREQLGQDLANVPEYGHLSEIGPHPRFAGSRLAGLMLVARDDPADRRVMFRVGPFYPEHPEMVAVYGWEFHLAIRLGFKLRHLGEVSERATRALWKARFLGAAKAAGRGCGEIYAALIELGENDADLRGLTTIYDPLIAWLETDAPLRD